MAFLKELTCLGVSSQALHVPTGRENVQADLTQSREGRNAIEIIRCAALQFANSQFQISKTLTGLTVLKRDWSGIDDRGYAPLLD